jgi:hypothetical protein
MIENRCFKCKRLYHFSQGTYFGNDWFCNGCRKPQTDPGNLSNEASGYKDETTALAELERAARYLYQQGWTAAEAKKAIGMHRLLSGDECLDATKKNWNRKTRPSL